MLLDSEERTKESTAEHKKLTLKRNIRNKETGLCISQTGLLSVRWPCKVGCL